MVHTVWYLISQDRITFFVSNFTELLCYPYYMEARLTMFACKVTEFYHCGSVS